MGIGTHKWQLLKVGDIIELKSKDDQGFWTATIIEMDHGDGLMPFKVQGEFLLTWIRMDKYEWRFVKRPVKGLDS